MAINVVFDKNGFYHPVYGRLGRGRKAGHVYSLPDAFGEAGMLPATARIIDDAEDLEEKLEDEGQRRPIKPEVLNDEQAEKITGAGRKQKPASAVERTAGTRSRRKKAAAE